MAGATLRIEQPTLSPRTTRVWLNGQDITDCLVSVTLRWEADAVTLADVTIGVESLYISAETIVNLLARITDPAMLETAIRMMKRAKAKLGDGDDGISL